MSSRSVVFAFLGVLAATLSTGIGCREHAVGTARDAGGADASTLVCTPTTGGLDCVELLFPAQKVAFTQAEASAGIGFVWELVVPRSVAEVYPNLHDAACCSAGVGPLGVRETVSGNNQYYCDCEHGLCAPSGCDDPPVSTLAQGQTTHTFVWPGVNWYGPSDTGLPYGSPFPRGEYDVQVSATGRWRPEPGAALVSYRITGELQIEIIDGCGDVPALQAAMWSCTGGVGEGGLCLDVTVDSDGLPVDWVPEMPLDPTVYSCLDTAIMDDCFPSLAGRTETVCIFGV